MTGTPGLSRPDLFDLATGLAAGYLATLLTDAVQKPLWQATPEREKQREPETRDGSSAMTAARKTAELAEADPDESSLHRVKSAIHYGLGAGWGLLYVLLRRNGGMGAMTAGMATGTALSLIVDEAINPALDITPPGDAYPMSSHLRGLAAHLVYGLGVAAVTEGMHLALRRRWVWA